MNERKLKNSAVLLADGLEIGHANQNLSYSELSGLLGNLLSVIRSHRTGWLEADPGNKFLPIPAVPEDAIVRAIEGKIAQNMSDATARRKSEEGEEDSKKNKHTGTNGTEDVIVIDDKEEEEEAEF